MFLAVKLMWIFVLSASFIEQKLMSNSTKSYRGGNDCSVDWLYKHVGLHMTVPDVKQILLFFIWQLVEIFCIITAWAAL